MTAYKNIEIKGFDSKPIIIDLELPDKPGKYPLMVFCHGFKGFKDWGYFNYLSESFARQGVGVLKFNFSHCGVSKESLDKITDSELFGNNNYSKELFDLQAVIDWLFGSEYIQKIDTGNLTLCGHSRGGGIAVLHAVKDKRIKKIITWAAVFDFAKSFRQESIDNWRTKGRVDVVNKRTGEIYPLYAQFYEDWVKNKLALDIPKACDKLEIPFLIIHGTEDESVSFSNAESFYNAVFHSILIKIGGAGHTFNTTHPFDDKLKNPMLKEVFENTIEFIKD